MGSGDNSSVGVCSYHLCNKKTTVSKCIYCGKLFCDEHLKPKPPGMPKFNSTTAEDKAFMVEWRKPGGHPCVPYMEHWKAEQEREKTAWYRTLDRLCAVDSVSPPVNSCSPQPRESLEPPVEKRCLNCGRPIPKHKDICVVCYRQIQREKNQSHKIKKILRRPRLRLPKIRLSFIILILILLIFVLNHVELSFLEDVNATPALKKRIDISLLEKKIHDKINLQRYTAGLSVLEPDQKLTYIAEKHSVDMSERNFFDHVNPDGEDPTARGAKSGYVCHKIYGGYYHEGLGENIFQTWQYNSEYYGVLGFLPYYFKEWKDEEWLANEIVNGWMMSPGHRKNILTSDYDKEGIGVYVDSEERIYVTQEFC